MKILKEWCGRLLCALGLHDYDSRLTILRSRHDVYCLRHECKRCGKTGWLD